MREKSADSKGEKFKGGHAGQFRQGDFSFSASGTID
jgi:hypothetical protein